MKSNIIKNQKTRPDIDCPEFKEAVSAIVDEKTTPLALNDLSNVSAEALVNKIADKVLPVYYVTFKHKETYKDAVLPLKSIDHVFIVPYDSAIDKVSMYNMVAGLGGATELDVKMSTDKGFVSIFEITPKIQGAYGNEAFVMTGQSKKGLVAPVVQESLILKAGTALRMDMLSKQSGNPADCGLTLFLRKL